MKLADLNPGDIVFAARDIYNDSSLPAVEENALIATRGCRGVLVNTGHLEEEPDTAVFLVRFENEVGEPGAAVGCWEEELAVGEI